MSKFRKRPQKFKLVVANQDSADYKSSRTILNIFLCSVIVKSNLAIFLKCSLMSLRAVNLNFTAVFAMTSLFIVSSNQSVPCRGHE